MTTTLEQRQLTVHCKKDGHEWSLGALPMPVDTTATVLKNARCPLCKGKDIAMGPTVKPTTEGDARAWLSNGDTGTSSLTIWSVLTGYPSPHGRYDIPYDPSDFGRCYRLLKVMPSWRSRLGEVAAACPKWEPFVAAWDELTALFEDGERTKWKPPYVMYERMKALRPQKQSTGAGAQHP